jgi:hypothetical protein
MRKNPWFPLAALLLFCGAFYLLIVTVGWGAFRTAGDPREAVAEAAENRPPNEISFLHGAIMAPDESKEGADPFRFPDDRAGQLLSKTLPPSEKSPAAHDAPAPRHLPPPAHLDKPSLPLPPTQADMPRLPAGKTTSLRPRPLPEELPLVGHKADPLVPEVQYLHAGDRVRVPSVDVNKPIPLPILALPVNNRAPTDDATSDVSLAAALAAMPPGRTSPAHFLKLNLPDPFENRLKPPVIPAEDVAPVHTGSRPAR